MRKKTYYFQTGKGTLLIGMLGLMFAFSCAKKQSQPVSRPNLIFIYTDDQRQDALGACGNEVIQTPYLDKIAKQAVRFPNAHVVFSLCSPSRAAALTGRYGSANGVLHLGSGLNTGEKTVAQYLQESGYYTAMMGKWHLKQKPQELGFDESAYFLSNGTYYGRKIFDGDSVITPEKHCDGYCVEKSIEFLEKAANSDQPFFLFHCTQLPHMNGKLVWDAKTETKARYSVADMPVATSRLDDLSDKPEYLKTVRNRIQSAEYGYPDSLAIKQHTLEYYAVITEMDDYLGRLFQKIEDLRLRENTYIIFMSDNGWMLGEHGFTSKVLPYAPSARVPMFVLGPGLKSGDDTQIVLNIDLAPTLLEWAGVPVPANIHGKSLKPLLENPKAPWRESFVYEGLGNYGGALPNLSVFDGTYRYIRTYSDSTLTQVEYEELYDQVADKAEMKNLAKEEEFSTIIRNLEQHIQTHRQNILGLK
ncbi:MAG: sulfatase-like hydrolase/transferase [Bacteroidia bacterium]